MKDKNKALVYSCSGCSSAAQLANRVAVKMDRESFAEMSCIAGVGGDVKPLVKTAKSGRDIIAIDGCPLECVKNTLARHNIQATHHFRLHEYGVKKIQHENFDPKEVKRITSLVVEQVFYNQN